MNFLYNFDFAFSCQTVLHLSLSSLPAAASRWSLWWRLLRPSLWLFSRWRWLWFLRWRSLRRRCLTLLSSLWFCCRRCFGRISLRSSWRSRLFLRYFLFRCCFFFLCRSFLRRSSFFSSSGFASCHRRSFLFWRGFLLRWRLLFGRSFLLWRGLLLCRGRLLWGSLLLCRGRLLWGNLLLCCPFCLSFRFFLGFFFFDFFHG